MIEKFLGLGGIILADPAYLVLFILIYSLMFVWTVVAVARYINRLRKKTIGSHHPLIGRMVRFCLVMIVIVMPLMIIALARPYLPKGGSNLKKGSVEVVFIVDNSSSMWVRDLHPSRISKVTAEIFKLHSLGTIRDGDRVSLVVFGKSSMKKVRLTKDLERFANEIQRIGKPESLIGDDFPWGSDVNLVLEDTYRFLDRQDNPNKNANWRPRRKTNRIILFFSDGDYGFKDYSEDDKKRMYNTLNQLNLRGLKIFSVGVGTKRGVRLDSVLWDYKKDYGYNQQLELELKEQGITRLDLGVLNLLSARTGGKVTTIESNASSAQGFLQSAISSNRSMALEVNKDIEKQELWREFLYAALFIFALAVIFY